MKVIEWIGSHCSPLTHSILTNVGRKKRCLSLECWWDFSGGPTIKTSRFHYKGHGVDPWLENKDPMCCMAWPKGKKSECWQSWGDLELSISTFSWDKLINPILLRQVLGIVLATELVQLKMEQLISWLQSGYHAVRCAFPLVAVTVSVKQLKDGHQTLSLWLCHPHC